MISFEKYEYMGENIEYNKLILQKKDSATTFLKTIILRIIFEKICLCKWIILMFGKEEINHKINEKDGSILV